MHKFLILGAIIIITGLGIIGRSLLEAQPDWQLAGIGAGVFIFGTLTALVGDRFGQIRLSNLELGSFKIQLAEGQYYQKNAELAEQVQKNELDQKIRIQRESYAETKQLPGSLAPEYSALELARINKLLVRPSAYPMTPMYMLDRDYRILDWNEAFSLAFDRTLEGRQGQSILEWTYHLDNFQEVLDHGEIVFADPERPPTIDVEEIVYTSLRYGRLKAIKRAYQIPDDNGACLAWLITLDLDFSHPNEKSRYRYELLRLMGLDQLWSEYAISYDRVLTNTRVYRELIDTLIGNIGPLRPIDSDARVLDLGAGTGNLSLRLMDRLSNRTVFALDNNRVMLEFLRDKCREVLREDELGPGVVAIKQDVTSLFGLPDSYFDCVIANNVFYALPDPEASLEAVFRVLKPGGELRASGPKYNTDLEILFKRIHKDLDASGKLSEYREDFERVEQINKLRLGTLLHKWSVDDFCGLVKKFGFKIKHSSEDVYAGQSMLIVAEKPAEEISLPDIDLSGEEFFHRSAKSQRPTTAARISRGS